MLKENSLECSTGFPYDEIDARENPAAPARYKEDSGAADKMEFARRLVSFVRTKDRCRITVDCLFLVLGDAELESITMTSVAKRHALTKAAISKRCKEIRQLLHLPISANNKSKQASARYAQTNRSNLRLDRKLAA